MRYLSPVRGRFAPSPTGRFHLGNARTSLLAWLSVRQAGGTLILRVEDLDPQRSKAEHERAQLEDLRWMGLDWDEGPDIGGPHAPYRQSDRAHVHAQHLERLDVYPCTCTRREINEASVAPHGGEPVYPGICADGPSHVDRDPALRWRVPDGQIEVHDSIMGTLRQDLRSEVGDFVVRRNDGAFAYQLAVVVDDAVMGVTEVCRGQDLWTSTPRQVALQRALGFETPSYLHVPLVRGPDGEKLNKRHGAPDLSALREGGADPKAVVAALARSANLVGEDCQRVTPHELVATFDRSQISEADARVVLSAPKIPNA